VLVALAAIGVLAAGFAFAAGCPKCVLRPDVMLEPLRGHYGRVVLLPTSAGGNNIAPSLGWHAHRWIYQLVATFPWAMGWPLYALAVLGVSGALRERALPDRLLVATFAAGLGAMGLFAVTYPRYYMPLYPPLVVLAARSLARWRVRSQVSVAVFALVWTYTLALSASQVARFSVDQQHAVAAFIEERFAARIARGEPPRIAYPAEWSMYTNLPKVLKVARLGGGGAPRGRWLEGAPEVFVMPDWIAIQLRRDRPFDPAVRELDALEEGRAGYQPAAHFRSRYLHQGLYTGLDPAFAADLWQGEIGFAVYLRDDLVGAPPS
jgi:hypothetical protein